MIWEQKSGTVLQAVSEVFNSLQFCVLQFITFKSCNIWNYDKNGSEKQDFSAFATGAETPPQCMRNVQPQIASFSLHRIHTAQIKYLIFEHTYKL